MIGIIVHHHAIPGKEADGISVIQANGRAMRNMKGFKARHTFVARGNKRQISTVTFWDSEEDYQRWMQSPEKKQVARPAGELWVSPPKPDFFDAIPER